MAKRLISNDRLPKPGPEFTGTRNRSTVLGVESGDLGQNVESHMSTEDWDDWRDEHGAFRANCLDSLPDF